MNLKWMIAEQLTRRGLWGHLPRRIAPAPEGPPMLALSFDLDYRADTEALPGLVSLMDRVGVKSTLFCIGKLVEQAPGPYRAAADAGHEIANHTWSHPDNPVLNPDHEFWDLGVADMADEIGRCQDALQRHTGQRPVGFRSPHFKDAFRMMEALARFEEIRYLSTALASKCPRPTPYFPLREPKAGDLSLHFPAPGTPPAESGPNPIMIPLTPCPGLRWSPFCSYSSIRRPSNPPAGAGLHTLEQWEALWAKMLDKARPRRFASVYFDPMDVMGDEETRAVFEWMLSRAVASGWDVTTLDRVERRWRGIVEAGGS